jgi:CheY-like chemotaxis protein
MDGRHGSFVFCQGCGESVETHRVVTEGRVERRCVFCGLILDARDAALETCERAIAVDDSTLLRDVLGDLLMERGLTRSVTACRDGSEFLTVFTESLAARRPPGFMILDVNMPIVNGIQAAIAARAIEKGFGQAPIPMVFFSIVKCDDAFRRVLQHCAPASYLNKQTAPTPEVIGDRLSAILRRMASKGD